MAEAFAMKKYLLSQNIPAEAILMEDQSTTTYENMLFSKAIIQADWQKMPSDSKQPSVIFQQITIMSYEELCMPIVLA